MKPSLERLRELGALAPHVYDFLAAYFNYDWDLDYADAESLYADSLDRLRPTARDQYVAEARLLERELPDDESVLEYIYWVGAAIDFEGDFGVSPVEWLRGLVERLEHPRPLPSDHRESSSG
ncbi:MULTISPECIES: contact-dependent growth inhibition system immunity protein [unclassified Curtobacterium]|uniref:contact-dependent growth inhibition system immunity protein n=1 Tax=unclassified Curtobacterium TaxID=257496 RepID=UPI0008DC8109|nr:MULTISPECIES: contact-dependent growth inhibition system immunity protein [unclassified Curtobacterium]WIA97499.1 contact-dependent growth inhibition system immunity protein [Curtobacterium sp. MCBA15_004]WIB00821.1 contact-dependent growth inhibition system immunity protein [Curtobacterium sp. MCBA15_012]